MSARASRTRDYTVSPLSTSLPVDYIEDLFRCCHERRNIAKFPTPTTPTWRGMDEHNDDGLGGGDEPPTPGMLRVCVYACVHACMRACVYACMRVCVYACMRASCMHRIFPCL